MEISNFVLRVVRTVLVLLLLGLTIWWLFFDEEIVEERSQVEKETKTPSPAQVAMSIEELSKMTKQIDEYAAKELNLKLDGRKKKGDLIAQVLEELSTQRPL